MTTTQPTQAQKRARTHRIEYSSALTEDYRDDMTSYDVYRTTLTFPQKTKTVDIWAEEETEVVVRGERHTIDAVRSVRVSPNQLRKVTVLIEANALAVAPLVLRTNRMKTNERFFAFPDLDAHQKLGDKAPADFQKDRKALGIPAKYKKADCENVGQSIINLSKAVQYSYEPTTGGFGKYESVVPEKMEDDHWMVDFSGDGATYQTLSAEQARAAGKGATRVVGTLAQGWGKKLKKNVKKADKVTVSTAKSASKSTTQAAKSTAKTTDKAAKSATKSTGRAAKSATKTTTKFGRAAAKSAGTATRSTKKALKNGQVLDTLEGLPKNVSKVGADSADGARQLAKDLRKKSTKVLVVTLEVAGEKLQFLLEKAKHIGEVIEGIFEKIGAAVSKALKWLADLFDWDDILHTQEVLKESTDKAIGYFSKTAKSAKKEVKGMIGALRDILNGAIDEGLEKFGGGLPASEEDAGGKRGKSKGSEKIDWLLNHMFDAKMDIPGLETIDDGGAMRSLFADIQEAVDGDDTIRAALGGAWKKLQTAITKPGKAPQMILGAVFELLRAALDLTLQLIEGVVNLMLDLAAKVFKLLRKFLNLRLPIPFVSKLFRTITKGKKLTVLNFLTLVVAIPVTVICKLAGGGAPFRHAGKIAQGNDRQLKRQLRAWGIVYAVCIWTNATLSVATDAAALEGTDLSRSQNLFFNIMGWVLGFLAQVAGFPMGHPTFEGWSWKTSVDVLANFIWIFQWWMLAQDGIIMLGQGAVADRVQDNFRAVSCASFEVVHFTLFMILIGRGGVTDPRLITCVTIDPLPGIMRVVYAPDFQERAGPNVLGAVSVTCTLMSTVYGMLYATTAMDA